MPDGQGLIGPVQWIIDLLGPLLFWTGVQAPWLQATALNVILLTSFVAKLWKMDGWKTVTVAVCWTVAYACAEYLPAILPVVAGSLCVLVLTVVALKAGGLMRQGGEKVGVIKPMGTADRGPSK